MRLPELALAAVLASSLAVAACAEVSWPVFVGTNIPWNHFGNDIGGGAFDAAWFDHYFEGAKRNGSNVARFWLHCGGQGSGLTFNASTGFVSGLTPSFTDDLRSLVSIAAKHNVALQLTLWSFDMCKDDAGKGYTRSNLISDPGATRSYVQNALNPMLAAINSVGASGGRNGVFFEVINEPEWCMKSVPCNTKDCVDDADMQRFVAAVAMAVHEAAFKVTVGSASLKWSSPTQPPAVTSFWDDASLRKHGPASGCASPTLDLYNIHYYDWMWNPQWGYDPCRANATYWGVTDRPTVVGELPATSKHYSPSKLLSSTRSINASCYYVTSVLLWNINTATNHCRVS